MTIGQRIKKLRLERDISQAELANKIGISQVLISQLELDKGTGTKHVASLANALQVNALWLQTGQGKPDLGYIPPAQKEYSHEIMEAIKLMELSDDRGRLMMLIALQDIFEERQARQKSLPRAKHEEDEAEGTKLLIQESLSNFIESEKMASDAYMPDNGEVRKDKRH